MRCSGRFQKDFTPDHIFTLYACAEKYMLRNGKFYVAYVDFSKAFDTVQRPILWNILLRDGEKRKNDQDPEKACTVLLKGLVHADLESIKWRPQQAYGSNQVLLSQPQTIFSTHKILTRTHR